MVAFIPKETILRYLGITAIRIRSFIIAAFASFFVAACSCTVIPVSAGVYFAGASIGAAFVILWVAPATNVLALTYTGAIIGWDMALVRILSASADGYRRRICDDGVLFQGKFDYPGAKS